MKKTLAIAITVLVLLTCSADINASIQEDICYLSSSADERIIQFMEEYDIDIPGGENNFEYWEEFIRSNIEYVECNNGDAPMYNWTVARDLSKEIIEATQEYYNCSVSTYASRSTNASELEHSTVIGEWNDAYLDYNCYSYAVNQIDTWYNPGNISGHTYSQLPSLLALCTYVEDDLEYWGHDCVERTIAEPNSTTLSSTDLVICLRIGDIDYHFMKLENGAWLHKPSGTNPLQWNYASPAGVIWTNERFYINRVLPSTTTYYSTIYYFVLRTNHSLDNIYANEHYHSGTKHYYKMKHACIYCGEVEYYFWTIAVCAGPPCQLEYTAIQPDINVIE